MLTLNVSNMIYNLILSGTIQHHLTDFVFTIINKTNFSDIPSHLVKASNGFLSNDEKNIYIFLKKKDPESNTIKPEDINKRIIALIKSTILSDSKSNVSLTDSFKELTDEETNEVYYIIGFECELFKKQNINENNVEETITIPEEGFGFISGKYINGKNFTQEQKDFIKWADAKFSGSVYDELVNSEPEEFYGTQRDVDDWDEYYCSEQDAIDYKTFWERLLETIDENFEYNEIVPASKMVEFIKKEGREIAEKAFEDFEPSEEFMTHKGHRRYDAWWKS